MGTITWRQVCWGIVLGILLSLPAGAAAPATITRGVDIFTTSGGTRADFTSNPLPADFFCTGSSAFSGSIPLTGVPLATSPAGVAGSTDTVVERLADGEASVTELAAPFSMSLPAVSKHLKVLEKAGLISRGRKAQWRPCRLEPEPLKEASEWLEEYRRLWEERLDRLDEYLRTLQGKEQNDG